MTELIHVYSTDNGPDIGRFFYCTDADSDDIRGLPFEDIKAVGADIVIRFYGTSPLREYDKPALEVEVKCCIAQDPGLLEALGDHWHL